MKALVLEERLLLTEMRISSGSRFLDLKRVAVDTSAEKTIVSAANAKALGMLAEEDVTDQGGVTKTCSSISVGPLKIKDFPVDIRELSEAGKLDGVLGLDFLKRVGAKINLDSMTLSGSRVI
ncbi:gag-polyprotein putative aspartyl protease [Evansella caseinilytica]|uniref:Gag-polyprotein putative aspartyl protease n=1 Tax=Evansella caseinilytica TaxID=1503961 RepID=A0A1H3QUL7_9BACI|nr:aspartyl protease family protein [Evansella caseinilytica]SDZ17020.1 gag-polyprotein putative aspartyl protease [Evansella caseinilytica]